MTDLEELATKIRQLTEPANASCIFLNITEAREVADSLDLLRSIDDTLIQVLCSQALADNLGDIRDAERGIWKLLGAAPLEEDDHEVTESAFDVTEARLIQNGMKLPAHLRD